jgi:selenocysteine-specific translation elongation factor
MKKWLIGVMMIAGLASFAQEKEMRKEKLTAEQRTELQVKKMTLSLDLNAQQQKEMAKILAEKNAKRDAMVKDRQAKTNKQKPTRDERFAMQKQHLDEQIAMKERVKKILTPEQFEKWQKHNDQKKHGAKKKLKNRREHVKEGHIEK